MKGKRKLMRIGSAALLLLFLCYLGFQLLRNMSDSIQTAEAVVSRVEDTVDAEGVFVRSQTVITGSGSSTAQYVVENGARVGKGQQVAVFFDSQSASDAFQTCRELENQLAALEEASATLTSGADSLKMDGMIYQDLQELAALLDDGRISGVSKLYSSLGQLVVSRNAGEAGQEQMETQIAGVKEQLEAARLQLSGGSKGVTAPEAGYFLKSADGYEGTLAPDKLSTLTPAGIRGAAPDSQSGQAVGSLVQDFAWYYAAVVDTDTAERLRNRGTVSVRFPQIGSAVLVMEIKNIRTVDGEAVVTLKSTNMGEQYLSARKESIQFVMASYEGIKVPREALRQLDGEWGVYCLDGPVAQFKTVNWVYQTDYFYLVPCAATPSEGLYRYDKMILKAKDLADNKVVS